MPIFAPDLIFSMVAPMFRETQGLWRWEPSNAFAKSLSHGNERCTLQLPGMSPNNRLIKWVYSWHWPTPTGLPNDNQMGLDDTGWPMDEA